MTKQEPPFAVQIELVEGCNLFCTFCGLRGIRTDKDHATRLHIMDPRTAGTIAYQLAMYEWNPRIEFAMHGEPTLHPNAAEMVRLFRERLPRAYLMMTSNGGGLLRHPGPLERIGELYQAGLNTLAIDEYQDVTIGAKLREALAAGPHAIIEYPDDPAGNPHQRSPKPRLVFVRDISKTTRGKGTHSLLNNHAGAGAPPNDKMMGKRCAKPFRELAFRWDGRVAVCCNDWRGFYQIGSIHDMSLEELWNHPRFHAARQMLILGQRTFGPCKGCDAVSYRTGLLPDKLGKETLPPPDATTERLIGEALAGEPYATPVKRDWEV